MSSWGNHDNSANAPLWAAMTENLAPTSVSIANTLYANTTANNVAVTLPDGSVRNGNKQVGLYLVSPNETQVAEIGVENQPKVTHAGWVLETTGVGGRAGRVTVETLVCLKQLGPEDGDGEIWANTYITLVNPTSASIFSSSTNANTVLFTTSATQTGNTTGVTYQWQVNNPTGSLGWTNVANTVAANLYFVAGTSTTASLGVIPKANTSNNYVFRVVATANNDTAVTATSANAAITIFAGA